MVGHRTSRFSRHLCASALVLLLGGCASLQSYGDAEEYIREGSRQWAESVQTGDTTALERILAEDFVGIDPKGQRYDKATMISNTKDAPKYFLSNRLNGVTIRFFGNTAVAQGDESWVRRKNNERGRFVWTDTWVKRNGRWQIVAAQDVIAPENAP
jgi:ketosteroid isomerase-like protein